MIRSSQSVLGIINSLYLNYYPPTELEIVLRLFTSFPFDSLDLKHSNHFHFDLIRSSWINPNGFVLLNHSL